MSDIYAVFRYLGQAVFACASSSSVELPKRKKLRVRSGAKTLRFNGWGAVSLIVLACCVAIATSGCGSGVSESVAGSLLVSPGSVNFGSVAVGHEADSTVTVTNSSSASMSVSQANVSGQTFSLVGGNMPISIPAGGNYTLKVGFTPVSAVGYSGQLTLMDASAQPIAQVPMQGQGSTPDTPQLTVSATSLNFGSTAVNAATVQTLTLTSSGTSPVTVNTAAITGTGFTIVGGSLPATLNPTQTMTLQVQFDPTSAGTFTGQIAISSTSLNGGTTTVPLSGTGTTTSNPQTSPQLTVSTTNLSFGSVTVNSATTQTLTLTSTGTGPVVVNSAVIAGTGFTIVGGTLPATLNPTQSMALQVQFDPTSAGTFTGQIAINSNSSNGGTATVALSGTGSTTTSNPQTSSQLTVSTTNLNFGSVTVNSATTQSLTLTSTGTGPVIVNSAVATGNGFTIVGGSLPVTLNPTQSTTLRVQYDPTSAGASTGQITIGSNSANGSTALVTLSGTGTAAPSPQLTLSSASLSFGSVTVNTPTTQSLTLTSTGTSPVTVNSAAITGTGFTIVGGNLPATLNPTQSMTLHVQFDPTAVGTASGQVTISSNSSSGSTAQVTLSGTSVAASSPQLTLSAATLSFGSVTVNTPTTQSLTLTSTGTSPVTVNSAAITGAGFTIIGNSLPATLNPTQSLTLQVQFDPTSAGAASGQITISSNSSTGATTVVILSGTSTTATSPQLAVSDAALNFGSVTVNTSTTKSLTLTSTGTSPVTVTSAAITGAGFTIVSGSLPATLSPTQSVTLQVQFLPTATGAASGQITISSNSSTGSTTVVTLGGAGTASLSPQLTVSATTLNFGSVALNAGTTQSLTLTSSGSAPVTVNSAAITGAGFTIISGSLPATLSPTQSVTLQVQFLPTVAGVANGQITISSNSSAGSTAVVALSGTGAGSSSPQLTVSAATLNFGSVSVNTETTQSVTLTSSGSSPVTVNSVTVTGTGFTIVAQSFPMTLSPSQSVTIQIQFDPAIVGIASGQMTISSNSTIGSTSSVTLNGTGVAAGSSQLTVSNTSLNFGSIAVNTPTTQTLTLTSTGTNAVTINSATITGTGFTIIGGSFPVTLNPTQTLTLQLQFEPTTTGALTGQLTISSNSTTGSSAQVALSGTGTAATTAHEVDLSWDAPSSSPDPVAGYNVYRSTGTGSFALVNTSLDSAVTYVDTTVVSGATYNYMVKSVDASGVESAPSNEITLTIP